MTLTIGQAAKQCHLTEPTLRGMIRRGELEPVRLGSRVFLTEQELSSKLGILFRAS
jgi:excisionase family DNA binding protein